MAKPNTGHNYKLGAQGEHYVKSLLESQGMRVHWSWRADLRTEGVEIEVKTAKLGRYRIGAQLGYQFCIRRAGRNGLRADLLVLVCWREPQPTCFVIPAGEVGKRSKVVISSEDPADYKGMWAPYREAWNLLADRIEEDS
jgi:hypothetical protein